MARRLGAEKNTLILDDNLSGSRLKLHYRMPTTEELAAYSNGILARQGNKVKRQLGEMRQKYGKEIMVGVDPASFEKMEGGKWVAIVSDPNSPKYDKDWKAKVAEQAPDIIETLAVHVFETSVRVAVGEEIEEK